MAGMAERNNLLSYKDNQAISKPRNFAANYCTTMNKRTLVATTLLTSTLFALSTSGQTSKVLSLQAAIDLGLAQNKDIAERKVQTHISGEIIKQQQQKKLPEVDFHASYARITDLTSFERGIKKRSTIETIPEWADATLSASMPLYRGGEIKYEVEKAKSLHAIEEYEVEKTENKIRMQVVSSFLGIYKLMELQKLIKDNMVEEEDRLREVKQLRKHGTVTTNEVLRAQLQLSDMELQLLSNQHQIGAELHYLKLLLETPKDEKIAIDTAGLLKQALLLDSRDTYQSVAMDREVIRLAKRKEDISLTEVSLIKTNYLPKISLFGSYAANFPNYLIFPPLAHTYTYGKIGIEATWSISGLLKNKSKLRQAKLQTEAEKLATENLSNEIADQVYRRYSEYLDILDRIPVTERAQYQAAENYRIVKVKYLHQLALITDMIDADNALLKARFNQVATRIDALMKHYELRYAAGLL